MRNSRFASTRAFWNLGWRYLLRHPWQSVLMVVGITLGVSVVVAIDLANASASRAFDLSSQAIVGRTTHQIVAGPGGLEEEVYTNLRLSGLLDSAAPILTEYITSPQLGERPFQLLGIDPFTDAPFRNYLSPNGYLPPGKLVNLLTQPGSVLLSTDLAERYGLAPGDTLVLEIAGQPRVATLAGLLQPADGLSQRALDGLVLADIATAQELTGRIGVIDRIDMILPEASDTPDLLDRLQAALPPDARLLPVGSRSGALKEMTAAFRLNLTALSLLALVVGVFLIYNTMTFSIVQRRQLFGTLRCLGVTRRELFGLVLSEAFFVGLIGAGLGVATGVALGQGAVRTVTQTINDLFYVLTVRGVQIPVSSLLKGGILGLTATLFSAILPAWEAASVAPRAALIRSGLEEKSRYALRWSAVAGIGLLLAAGLSLLLLPRDLVSSFAATFAVIIGFAMLAPLGTKALLQLAARSFGWLWGALGRMAPRAVINSMSRTAIAIAALMVAVSVTIGVGLMVNSFRYTVTLWLEQTLQGDIYISAPGLTTTQPSAVIDPRVITEIDKWPGIARVDVLRSVEVDSPRGPVHLAATNNPTVSQERLYLPPGGSPQEITADLDYGAVLVSEPLANRLTIPKSNGHVDLFTDRGLREFPVAGIYYDYASTQGTILMTLSTYQRYWHDPAITAISLRLEEGVNHDQLTADLEAALTPLQRLVIRPNRTLRQEALLVFDRTFTITAALQLLATVVAFIGILSALLSLQLERQRELGILRAVGLTTRQVWALVISETSLMGAVAGLLAMPTGFVLALILIYIINRRSFGWTLQLHIEPLIFLQAMLVALVAALLAGIYPAIRMSKITVSTALRSE